ncbi:phosphonate C-P lyase system protein PhnH [Macrococcoides canis]|uniref:phosphonate C-P lyase system protein PhnH n=1 Tax=Macrococcoides canis TaxID=1855823 RepID=UPI001F3B9875|nr:phosphonate C-P lyase system protein PhnH [Macrococcus canis]UJS28244.1 phosphonate C-P lyase system protein PhnH [Macrococcus canis]
MYVHEMTRMFRQVMDAMSKPGVINEVDGISHRTSYSDAMYLLLQTLLDNEVSFHLLNGSQSDVDEINLLLNSKVSDIASADYIVMKQHEVMDVRRLSDSKKGTYIDPEISATWIIEVDDFTAGENYLLKGPGIKEDKVVVIPGVQELLDIRNQLCASFPLGVDLIFVADKEVMCIPRTTVVKEVN